SQTYAPFPRTSRSVPSAPVTAGEPKPCTRWARSSRSSESVAGRAAMSNIVAAGIALRKGLVPGAASGTLTEIAATAHSRRIMSDDPHPGVAALDQLQTTLEAALTLVRELADDGLLGRLIATFRAMPTPDRPVIIGVLEREVTGRLLSRATERAVGQATYPNPNARLYIRPHEPTIHPRPFGRAETMISDTPHKRVPSPPPNQPHLYDTRK